MAKKKKNIPLPLPQECGCTQKRPRFWVPIDDEYESIDIEHEYLVLLDGYPSLGIMKYYDNGDVFVIFFAPNPHVRDFYLSLQEMKKRVKYFCKIELPRHHAV